ncbi:hypothetical protein GCM10010435_59270 [Winogradskya consettensis]|uniref:Uncharacterized protein n=1 Tax=Winogradskya consettensis TaxID=113560 RepID=A0A919SKN3_9ACTN|nr:hypothetical protein [Actinoplanes consettensis]GIM74182.1 hypothetical protein Aco04nite_39010 [Actinoplanes consettensis]
MRKVLLIVAGVVVVLCGVGGWFGFQALNTGREISRSSITQQQFDAQQVGGVETTVRDALPTPLQDEEQTIYGDDVTKQGKPDGATCTYYAIKPITDGKDRPLFRFCFAGGKLTEKKQIRIDGA